MNFPSNVLVVGGGRWSRVLLGVLCELVPSTVNLFVQSSRNASAMEKWASMQGIESRLKVSSNFPEGLGGTRTAIIVANAASDHAKSVERALLLGAPVLVEKPIALDFVSAQRLAALAGARQTYLAASNVFLFAAYVERFSRVVSHSSEIRGLHVHWSDPQVEVRHGETKSYDPALPVYADWLPHIISVLSTLTGSGAVRCTKVDLQRGGAELAIDLMLGSTPCSILLARNGDSRRRVFQVQTAQDRASLDFSQEPGTIEIGTTSECADPLWTTRPKPLSKMLAAFLEGASSGVWDDRLDVRIGLRACDVIDQVTHLYQKALLPWLSRKVLSGEIDADFRYALSEILLSEDPHSNALLAEKLEHVSRQIKGHSQPSQSGAMREDPVAFVRSLARQM